MNKILGQIVSLRVKTLSNTNLVAPRHITGETGSLPVVVLRSKTSLLKLPKGSECEDCEWDSDYGNHQSAIVIVLDWYEGHRGVILEQKLREI